MKAQDVVVYQDASTGNWYAMCDLPDLGRVVQWGTSAKTALENLRDYVVMVLKGEWEE